MIVRGLPRDQKRSPLKLAAAAKEDHTSHTVAIIRLDVFAATRWPVFWIIVYKSSRIFILPENVDFFLV